MPALSEVCREAGQHPMPLTERQRAIVEKVVWYCEAVDADGCSGAFLARKFDVHPSTMREQLEALYRKGWLNTDGSPVTVRAVLRQSS